MDADETHEPAPEQSQEDELAQLQDLVFALGAALDLMILVASQAEDLKAQRLIDAALTHAGLLAEGQSAFGPEQA